MSDSFAPFPTTAWTLIREAQAASRPQRAALLHDLLRRYWKPVYTWYRATGKSPHDAEDLVQGFLCEFVAGEDILRIDQPQKRFRDWVRVCARNHMLDQERRSRARKRRPERGVVSFADLAARDGLPYEPADPDADVAFDDIWRREILVRAVAQTEQYCRGEDRSQDFRIFMEYYVSGHDVTWQQLAERHDLADWKIAARRAEWVKRKLAGAIRDEVRLYVESEEEVDVEINRLLR